jgi:serine O-acetyltransferase
LASAQGSLQLEGRMENPIDRIAAHLAAARERNDALTRAHSEGGPDPVRILEVLERLREIVLDRSATERLRCDLEVVHGLLTGVIGQQDATQFLELLPDIRQCVSLDLEAAFQGDPSAKTYAEILTSYPSVLAVSTYRIAHALYLLGHPVVARAMSEDAHSRTGIDINPGARIGCHFFIDHGTGVVIGETTEIGNRVKLYHGVTLGAFSNRHGRDDVGKKRHPTIEDDVTIYANASVMGGDTVIGHHSVIGGSVWLIHSLPPYTRVSIEPPRLQVRSASTDALRDTVHDYDL